MKYIKLKKIIKSLESGGREKGGSISCGIPSLGAQHLDNDGKLKLRDMKFVSVEYYENMNKGKIEKNDILIVKDGATTGKVSFVDSDFPYEKSAINEHVFRITLKERYLPKYVFWYLFSQRGQSEILKDFRGATVGGISTKFVDNVEIPDFSLETQKKIVEVLDKAQGLIDARKEQIRLMDELIQSVFYEMFGDPVTNPKGWEVGKLGEIGSLERGKSKHRPRNAPELLGGEYPLIQTGDIANAGLYIYDYSQTYSELGLQQSKIWDKGTLCITIAANIAKTSILGFDACFPDSIVAFIPNKNVESMYVQILFGFLQKIIEANAPESAQKNINLKILRDIDIPLPDIYIQKNFCKVIDMIEAERKLLNKSLTELENNYHGMMKKLFEN